MTRLSKTAALAKVASATESLAPTSPASAVRRKRSGKASAGRTAMPELPLWQQLRRIGGSLTPLQVSNIIVEADQGRMAPLMDLANEARQKDCHLQAVLSTSEGSVACLEWELVPPKDPSFKERKAHEFIEDWLRHYRDLSRILAHQTGSSFYGYSVSEIDWGVKDSRLVPECIHTRAHRRFIYARENGILHWYDQNNGMTLPGIDIRTAYPDKFIISQPRINGDVQCREGLVRVLMWAALFRNWSISDWLKLGEIAWKPWRTAKYPKLAGDDQINALIATLEGMSASGIAVYPDDSEINVQWPKFSGTGTSMHAEIFSVIAAEMSKCVLGQTLTTEQGRIGSQALGRVHNEVRKDLREQRAKFVSSDFSRDLIEPMTRLNWGPDVRASEFRLVTEEVADLKALSESVKNFTDAKLRIPVGWIWDQAGIPVPEDGEECVGGPDAAVDPNADPGATPAPATPPEAMPMAAE